MGANSSGALNVRGFTDSVNEGTLPD